MLPNEENKTNLKDMNQDTSKKYTIFSHDSKINSLSPIYLFCKSKSEINSQNENGWTPIYRSIIANNLEALYELLKLGANPNIPNNLGETPLYLSVDIDNYDALIILLQYKADCNLSKKNGNTPLHIAAKRNKTSFLSALLRNNANPNIVNKLYSQTATHLAIINKMDESILNEFSNNKADIYNIKDKYDKAPFDYAKDVGDQNYINMLKKIFSDNPNNSSNNKNKNIETWGEHTPYEIEDNMETTPVKVNYADQNNSNFISLAKNVFISFDENDSNKNNGSVIIKNVKEDNKNNIYNSPSNNSESNCGDKKIINTDLNNKRRTNNNDNKSINFTEPKSLKTFENKSKSNQRTQKSKKEKEEENIKNNSIETVKKINVSNNSVISSNFNFSAENNYSISYNNSKNNINSGINSNIFRLSSIYSNNSKKNNNNKSSNPILNCPTKRDMSEMNPLEMINQVITTSNNSNIFSELQINSIYKKHTQSDEDINKKTIQENISNINSNLLNDSLEYTKTNAHAKTEQSNQKEKNDKNNKLTNNDFTDNIDTDNINGLNITINEYEDINKNNGSQHKQLSYTNKENKTPNSNLLKRNSNLSTNNYSLNNSKKLSAINNTNQNELLTTVPNSIIGENNIVVKKKYYKNNQTQPDNQKEKITKDLVVDEYQNNIESMNTYNNSYKQYPNITIKNSVANNNKSTNSTLPNNNNFIYSCSNNTYSINNI